MFIATLFIIAETWKQPKCPLMEEWIMMDKEDVVCVCIHKDNGILPIHKK